MPMVYLVGAGPGDPDLLTVKARRLLEQADVVVYDRLVGEGVLALVPKGAARIYVGKAAGAHHLGQDEINELLVRAAKPGRTVVRLKGGDPFIFGRGSEEAIYLRERGVRVEVVPGITAASGCCSALGVPLTHRGLASGFRIVTGHAKADEPLALDWRGLADPDTTLVVYMGLAHLPEIAAQLIEHGLPAGTPTLAIERGTTAAQRFCQASLADLPAAVATAGLAAPALIVIGRVVSLMAAEVRAVHAPPAVAARVLELA